MRRARILPSLLLLAALPAAASHAAETQCRDHDPNRNVYWGDLHIHTAVSMDANVFGTRLRPSDAYRFARGEEVALGLNADRPVRLERPLDFAAITDHASNMGGVSLCTTPGSPVYNSASCAGYREPLEIAGSELTDVVRRMRAKVDRGLDTPAVCGEDGALCRMGERTAWAETRKAAADFNDSAPTCAFTSFVAYEYTATPEMTKIHRNVIFRNETVPEIPISYDAQPSAIGLWRDLEAQCTQAGSGCDVLAIPHNSNLSNGHMFGLEYEGIEDPAEQAEIARLRAAMEPIVEMSQMKGDSECRNGMWNVLGATDELCDWEKIRATEEDDCEDGTGQGALAAQGCVSRRDFVRYALVEGLQEEKRLGVNPFRFGFIAATDGHDGTPGAVEEWRQDLVLGAVRPTEGRNLGGLAGVWAEENSREALFEAMRRRETYGTSGPRMSVRFFGGFDLDEDLCGDPALVAKGYASGVPMGGELGASPRRWFSRKGQAPRFVVSALADTGTEAHPGGLLQRVQIIKGWADDDGRIHQQVVDVAGGDNDAGVDLSNCTPTGTGARALCGEWTDPDFDPDRAAVYYARVVENPSCRQSGWACVEGPDRPAWCDAPATVKTTRERAWTSPIWVDGR
ncbi:MAG: DUF3604 domain-containing protein [Myxococcota bacterium]